MSILKPGSIKKNALERRFAHVGVRFFRYFASAWRTFDETFLDQEWFIHFFQRTRFFPYSSGNGSNAHGAALESFR